MCPNMKMSPSALRYDCDAHSSHTSGELYERMTRDHHRFLYGGGCLMVFVPSSHVGPPALLGGPLDGGEPASSSTDHPVNPVVPFYFPKGKGKNYSMPPWYNQHFGFPDPQSRDEEEAPEENTLTLLQESFDLPNDTVRSHRYGFGKGKGNRGGPIVKGKPAYTLECRNDTGKGKQVQTSGTPSSDHDDAPDGWHEWRRTQEAIYAAQDNGAGAGDDMRHWREPEFNGMFPRPARTRGDTPPSGYGDSDHGYPGNWSHYYDFGSHREDDVGGEDEDEPDEPGAMTCPLLRLS